MPTVLDVAEALADALRQVSPVDDLIVEPRMIFAPATNCIDIYPSDPAEDDSAFGADSRLHWFTVRFRVPTLDEYAAQDFLYASRDASGLSSVREALHADGTDLADLADGVVIFGPSGFQLYEDITTAAPRWLGHEWRVGVHVSEEPTT